MKAEDRTQNTDTYMADKGKENMKENKKDAHKSRGNAGKNHVTETENFRKRKYQVGRSDQRCQMQRKIKLKMTEMVF